MSAGAPSLATGVSENDSCVRFSDLSPPVAKDTAGNELSSANASQLIIIFSTFSNPCNFDQQVVIVTEARSLDGTTVLFEHAIVSAGAFNTSEVGLLWSPENAGTYELRSFALSNSGESQALTGIQTRDLLVVDYDLFDV